jgi:hypothetical protein
MPIVGAEDTGHDLKVRADEYLLQWRHADVGVDET